MTILIPFAALAAAPWKNGGGSTTEIAIDPPGATLANFNWRVSLATIAHSGPFSVFPGIDRTLALVEGAGVALDIEGHRQLMLEGVDDVIDFAGEAHVLATLQGSSTTDFNVMSRRALCHHKFGRRRVDGYAQYAPGGQRSLVFLAEGDSLTVSCDDERIGLVRYDCVLFEPGKLWTLEGDDVTVFIVDFYQRAAKP